MTFWGLSDGDSWLNRGRANYPLLWDRQRQPKRAYQAVVDVSEARAAGRAARGAAPADRRSSSPSRRITRATLRRRRNRRMDGDAWPRDTDLRLQVDDSPQQRRRAQGRQARPLERAGPRSRSPATSPEMIYVAVEAYADLTPASAAAARLRAPRFTGGNTGRNNGLYAVGAAVAPAKIGLSTPRPADFDAFWDGKLAAQAKIPINAGADAGRDRRAGRRDEHVRSSTRSGRRCTAMSRSRPADGKFPARHPAAVRGCLRAQRARRREARRRRLADDQRRLARQAAVGSGGQYPAGYQAVGNTRSRDVVLPEHVSARLARARLPADAARLGRQDDRPDGRQHGRPAESRARRPAARQDQRRAGLRAGRRGLRTATCTAARPVIRTGRRTIPT